MVDLLNYQTKNIEKFIIRNFLRLKKKDNFKSIYFNLSQACLGLEIFKSNGNLLKIIFYNLKNMNNTIKIFSSKIIHKSLKRNKFKNIFITWGEKKNFDNKGFFFDHFFNVSSKKNDNLFLVINTGHQIPKKIEKNIILFTYDNKNSFKNYLKFLKLFLINITSPLNFLINFNWQNIFEYEIKNKINSKLIDMNFNCCKIIYEGQNYQDSIVELLKRNDKEIKTKAFISSIPSPYPINYYNHKKKFIDEINVYSHEQMTIFRDYLKWPNKKIKIIKSTRFKKGSFNKSPFIYFPIDVINFENIISNFDNFLKNSNNVFCTPKLKFHPRSKSISKKKYYKEKIRNILRNNKKNFSHSSKEIFSFFVGPTGALIEALENGVNVIQICDNNIFDNFNVNLWKNLKLIKLSEGVNHYSLKKKNKSLIMG